MKSIDLSHEIYNNMPIYPVDIPVTVLQDKEFDIDHYNAYSICTGLHAGTHIDCPMHLLPNIKTAAEYNLDSFMGNGVLIDARGEQEIMFKQEYDLKIKKGDIVLIYTGMDEKYGTEEYYKNHPVFTKSFAEFLVNKQIKLVGMDMPSPDYAPFSIHKVLLNQEIFIMENITNLTMLLNIEKFYVIALPLKIKAEASLVRAVAVYK